MLRVCRGIRGIGRFRHDREGASAAARGSSGAERIGILPAHHLRKNEASGGKVPSAR